MSQEATSPDVPPTVSRSAIAAWCTYDWSATPFHSVINTFVFSIYFSRSVYGDETLGSAAWAYAAGAAGLAVALLSPICGAIADRSGGRKGWIALFTAINVVAVAGMWFVLPQHGSVPLALALMMLATVGGEVALVFYNALLPELVPSRLLGRISGLGWASGYLGGLAALGLVLLGLVLPHQPWFGIATAQSQNIRLTGPLVAVWGAVFAIPLFFFVRDRQPVDAMPIRPAARAGLRTLGATLGRLPQHRDIMWFLISSALYRDGLNTLFAVGGQYAAGTFGMSMIQVLEFGIGINISAIFGCLAFGWLDDRIGARATVAWSLAGLLATGLVLVCLTNGHWFVPIALVLGLFIGPAQSSGRSLMARLAPPELVTEMFGLYQFAGKSVSFLGPLAFAVVTSAFDSQRAGIATVLLFILAGLVLLRKVRRV